MAVVSRLRWATGALAVTAAAAMVGSTVFGDIRPGAGRSVAPPARPLAAPDDGGRTKFTDVAALAYTLPSGETAFAWQLRPALPATTGRPRDVLVMLDTSASQAGTALDRGRAVLTALAQHAGPDDRIDVWTVNINHPSATRSLTDGFQPAAAAAVTSAIARLTDIEYGSGAADLPAALEQAMKSFAGRPGRAQVLLYLGDGESAASPEPMTEPARVALGNKLADREVAFFAVPLGVTLNAHNLHGLASLTGGTVIRIPGDLPTAANRAKFASTLQAAFDAPILRPERTTYAVEGAEVYPTRLPPMRADRPTLVVGKAKAAVPQLAAKVEGRVDGKKTIVNFANALPSADPDHFFLAGMLDQWRSAPSKDAPALLPADRTLAMAAEQFRLFRDEFAVQAVWAITAERYDHAKVLFEAAADIDPACVEAKAGMTVLQKVRAGLLSKNKVAIGLAGTTKVAAVLQDLAVAQSTAPPVVGGGGDRPKAAGQPQVGAAPAAAGGAGASPAERELIQQARAAQAVVEQEFRVLVDDTLRSARRLLNADPDAAYEDLKRQRDSVQANDQLSESARRRLVQDLETAMREVQLKGAEIKRQLASQRDRIAQARQRLNEYERRQTDEERTRARIAEFTRLMNQARFELAQQEAQVMIQERVSAGRVVPEEAYASYRIGQAATNLREQRELKRVRENNYLLTMMQVEKSFIPYPDEPPVHYPPAAVWRELTGQRVELYGNNTLGPNVPASFNRLRSLLEGQVDRRVNIQNLASLTLDVLLQQLSEQFQDYGVRFVYRTDLFPADAPKKPGEHQIRTANNLTGLALGDFLDIVLRDLETPMSWIARPEYIEIGPMTELRYNEKATRVFDVSELAFSIPSSVNPSTLYAGLQIQAAQATIFGAAFVPQFGFGGGNGVNPFQNGGGGQFGGGFGGGGFGGGGQFAGGGQFQGGMGAGQFQGGAGGGQQFQGNGQFAGGGQFVGNTQSFGIQGNDQSAVLLQLITSVVARNEWDLSQLYSGQQQPLFNQDQLGAISSSVEVQHQNSLGFYPPVRALMVRGSHRYHTSPSFKLKAGADAGLMGAGGPGRPGRNPVAIGDQGPKPAVVADPKAAATDLTKKSDKDPRKLWNLAFERAVTQPDLAVDAVDILFHFKEYTHAAEAIKAGLRKGRATGDWVHDALAVALKASQAAPAEVERAALSAVDLGPGDPTAYLAAARAENDLGNHDAALAFCKRAAGLEPNAPTAYADALVYAEAATEVRSDAVQWAASHLLARDWPADGTDYHTATRDAASRIAKKLPAEAAAKLRNVLATEATHDLVIEMLYQGPADLDLVVTEPAGSICSATHKRTTGGGLLTSDVLEQRDDDRSEIYTAASAFGGTYSVSVKPITGRVVGNRATLKVTRFQGTPKQSIEVHSVDLTKPASIAIQLTGGSRTELATVPTEASEARRETTQAPAGADPLGTGYGGVGGRTVSGSAAVPLVPPTTESKVSGITSGLGLRMETTVSADRKNYVVKATPVFTGAARKPAPPRMSLLPGGAN